MKPEQANPRRVGDSIARKFNAFHIFDVLGLFIFFDMLILILTFGAAVTHGEQSAVKALQTLQSAGTPSASEQEWLAVAGVQVIPAQERPEGTDFPSFIEIIFPKGTRDGVRRLRLPEKEREDGVTLSLTERLDTAIYEVAVQNEGGAYTLISTDTGHILYAGRTLFQVLLIIELVLLIGTIVETIRKTHRILSPIAELAQAAQALSTAHDTGMSLEEMQKLAGKLDTINAAKLDTRIAVDTAQEELKTLAGAINGMLERINEGYRAQIRFVSDASHELRTPISVIQGYANLLDRWGKNDTQALQESIDAIKSEAANMKELVEQLLFLARGDNNSMQLSLARVDLCALAEEALRETRMIDSAHTYLSQFMPAFALADEALLKQALRILVDNAIKYTPPGGQITLSTSAQGAQVCLTVQDSGIGIPPEAVPKVFDRFYRADESRARATGGTGLGLSIAKWIAERHGGHMELVSREDIGTRVSIVLPEGPPCA